MDYRRASRSLEPSSEHGVGGIDGERVWIELFANPLDLLGVLGMLGVGENSHEMLIAPRTAAVLGRTVDISGGPGRGGTGWRLRLRCMMRTTSA